MQVLERDVVAAIELHRNHEVGAVGVQQHLFRVRVDDHAARSDGVTDVVVLRCGEDVFIGSDIIVRIELVLGGAELPEG